MPLSVKITISADTISVASFMVEFVTLLVAIVSAVYAYRAYMHQKERSKKAAACDLAKYYAEVILEKHSLIANIFAFSGLGDYIKNTICLNDISTFNRKEIEGILKQKGISPEEFYKKMNSIDPLVILNCRLARTYSNQERDAALKDMIFKDPETGTRKLKNATYILNDFYQEMANLMNQLEWFSMNCRYGLADEALLYQSLHQTFLSSVWVLYPFLCKNNYCNEDKHYTNVAWLFNTWHGRLCDIKKKAEKKKERYQRMADSVDTEIFEGQSVK